MLNERNWFHLLQKKGIFAVVIVLTLLVSGCSSSSPASSNQSAADEPFKVTSAAFQDGGRIADKYTSADKNVSVPLTWSNPPKDTQSFAVLMIDVHPIADQWVHWGVVNIPVDTLELPEGVSGTNTLPAGSKELLNSFGNVGYGGPLPPSGSGDHNYKCIVFALNEKNLNLPDSVTYSSFLASQKDHILGSAEINGFYEVK
ncbi:YbhB/YbcL family Raf kinase inhibitor-like protein [Paenibacillus sp. YPG26]|uniref:YbhB/YbcL family Raf kinase inhibitor-like protein n=1 Tax=Paenibacillus sp. YPG26 TaxID=2878915 RepID=UPI00203F0675|nr:YbhB/YbcL family Raf kinase inhibitor-like protein [Paenibacillus sp. YPG26]USB31649.1 YbhB/YbcL family Raf kinase inhibitor-like protein [Paenibacillus sp. YPG26]